MGRRSSRHVSPSFVNTHTHTHTHTHTQGPDHKTSRNDKPLNFALEEQTTAVASLLTCACVCVCVNKQDMVVIHVDVVVVRLTFPRILFWFFINLFDALFCFCFFGSMNHMSFFLVWLWIPMGQSST